MAQLSGQSSGKSTTSVSREDATNVGLLSKHKIFLSHSGAQKDFVEQLCVDLEHWERCPFFDKCRDSLPIGENFPQHIFEAIRQCQVGVVVLSEEFFTRSKWPMIELVAMVREAKKRELSFKIMPVFLHMSIDEFCDPAKRNGWRSCWHELALKDKRVDVKEWEDALKYLEPLNSMVYDGLGKVKFRKEIVDVICGAVPLERRLEDSHIQGRSRLCKVIQESISMLEHEKNEGVVVVGLYGMGGIGKTSICKALCNEYVSRFGKRVCHAELERKSKEELLREALKRLCDTSRELLDGWNEDELLEKLNSGIIKEPIFLAVDNVGDVPVSIEEAKCYVSARVPRGSIMVVTSRSKETLKLVRPDLVGINVMEMPELNVEEARSLFCKSYQMESRCEIDDGVVKRYVERCYFQKGDGNGGFHYHPLALDVLGKQLAYVEECEWKAHLEKIDKDIFNQSGEVEHQVFSILRKSYDMLTPNDQLLFMDVALFLPSLGSFDTWFGHEYKLNMFEWLGMVHGASVDDVVHGLKRLRRKSLLENLGDGRESSIGMHDLWRVFCKAEVQCGEVKRRRWMYGANGNMELIGRCAIGGCWKNVARMAFLESDLVSVLESVNFASFPHVVVVKVQLDLENEVVWDLSGLGCLMSLEIAGWGVGNLVLVGLPRCLVFLRLAFRGDEGPWHKVVREVGYLTKLQHLELHNHGGGKLPDLRSLVSLRVALFYNCKNVVTLSGLSRKLSNLRVLHFDGCSALRSCPGLGDVVGVGDLSFRGCRRLKRLPYLGKLRNLRKLVGTGCPLINELPGLDDLVALEELRMGYELHLDWEIGDSYRLSLPDMSKLRNLRVMRLPECRLESLPGFDSLVSLEEVEADFREVVVKPSLRQLTKLQALRICHGWDVEGLNELNNLAMLRDLKIEGCFGVDDLPDMQGLISLQALDIWDCGFKGVDGLSNLITLESLMIFRLGMLETLPALQRLTKLKSLYIDDCRMLRKWDCRVGAVEGSPCRSVGNWVGSEVPDCQPLRALRSLSLSWCRVFEDVMATGAFSDLKSLEYSGLGAVTELPDLSCFPRLNSLDVSSCKRLTRLTIREPILALTHLTVSGCDSLMALPDLSNFPGLVELSLKGCAGISRLSTSEPLRSLRVLDVASSYNRSYCDFLGVESSSNGSDCVVKELPDLGLFPALERLSLQDCTELTSLRSSVPLPALGMLEARGCTSLSGADLDELQALCPQCYIMLSRSVALISMVAAPTFLHLHAKFQDESDNSESDVTQRGRLSRICRCFRG